MGTARGRCPGGHSCSLGRGRAGRDGGRNPPPLGRRPTHRTLTPAAAWAQGTAVEARPAVGTAGAVAVVQAALAAPRVRVAGGGVAGVDVVVALAGPAGAPPGLLRWPRAPEVAGGAAVTARSWEAVRAALTPRRPGRPEGRHNGHAEAHLPAPRLRAGDSSCGPSRPAEPGEGRLPLSLPVALAQASLGAQGMMPGEQPGLPTARTSPV